MSARLSHRSRKCCDRRNLEGHGRKCDCLGGRRLFLPDNLDRDPPIAGWRGTQQALFHRALNAGWAAKILARRLDEQANKS